MGVWARLGLVLAVVGLLLGWNVAQASPATFTVNSVGDGGDVTPGDGVCRDSSGVCTLRAAIQEANAWPGADIINFNILPWGVKTITPGSPLPAVTERVTIDGGTQIGTAPRNIQLDGSSAGTGVDGLVLLSNGNVITGLVINRFVRNQVTGVGGNGVVIRGTGGNVIEKNYIGTNVWGTAALPNGGDGVLLETVPPEEYADENTIGGDTADKGNVISGNSGNGVHLTTKAKFNTVKNNRIGLAAGGTYPSAALANGGDGVFIETAANHNTVANNAIAGNEGNGVHIAGSGSDYNTVSNDCIGFRVGAVNCITASSTAIPNEKNGVLIEGGAQHNTISADELDGIAANLENGVRIWGTGTNLNSVGPSYRIFENGMDGVIIGGGAQSNTVANNHIAGNGGHGVRITGSGSNLNLVEDNCIGRNTPPFQPPCSYSMPNALDGVSILDNAADFNTITENHICDNGGLGIDLNDDGVTPNGLPNNTANDDLDFPILTTVTLSLVAGWACPNCTVEVFKAALDPSGYGEGCEFLGSTVAGGTGYFSLAVSLNPGDRVTVTATNDSGNTSEFSGWGWPVGGIAELPDVTGSSSPNRMAMAGTAAAALAALTAGAWYARRRWVRR